MDNILNKLSKLISKFEDISEIQKRSNSFSGDFLMTEFYKKSEDGILENIHNATSHQIDRMYSYNWKFYTQYNDKTVLKSEILMRVRESKIKKLCNL